MTEKKKYSAPAVEKALDILELMIRHNQSYTVTELATTLDMSTNSAFRIMKELEDKHYVSKNPADSSYELTSKIYYLGRSLRSRISLVSESHEALSLIHKRTNETVLLTTLDETMRTLVVDQLESPLPIKFLSTVGHSYLSHCSAMGKCLLAFSGPEAVEQYIATTDLAAQTPNTIVDPKILRAECQTIREQGVAYDNEESVAGLTCIACPIFSAGRRLRGSIGISAISFRLPPMVMLSYERVLKEQCLLLSERLGYEG